MTIRSYSITVIPGDGIGQEVVPQAVKVLEAMGKKQQITFHLTEVVAGGCAIDLYGVPLPEESVRRVLSSDAVLLGAVGGPKWEGLDYSIRPERALLGLREKLGAFANLRPALFFPMLAEASPLRRGVVEGTDLLLVRELTGGIYFGRPKGIERTEGGERGINTEVYTSEEIARVARVAFEVSQKRRRKVTSVDKANVLESSELWRRVVTEVHTDYPDVTLSHMYVDNCAMQLVKSPTQFDVILTSNLFGDILSDESAAIVGSIGMLPSASIGGKIGLFEPIHGSAPDIAGKDQANPLASILSVAMMFTYSFGLPAAGEEIKQAVVRVLEKGYRTADIHSPGTRVVGTQEMGDLVVRELMG